MDKIPGIVMKCPKCGRSFPMDATYCEDCTAMLEPVEQEAEAGVPGGESGGKTTAPSVTEEAIEDMTLETLKADVEHKFISTLLLELKQARSRLQKKEGVLSGLIGKGPAMGQSDYAARSGGVEAEMDGLIKKIAKLESMLENLKDKIKGDITGIESGLSGLKRPGITGAFSGSGRYYRMLASELKTKKGLLGMLESGRPPTFPTFSRMHPVLLAGAIGIVLAAAILAAYFSFSGPGFRQETVASSPQVAARQEGITEKEINALLEDIRKANLSKDARLWESRYSRAYLEQKGRREGILEQWARIDYKSLAYKVDDIRINGDRASAAVTWSMDLVSKQDGSEKTIVQQLLADFAREDGVLKISSVRKQ